MTLLKNQYRLIQELGTGAFGKTYLAEDTHSPSNRRCVIKHLTWNHDPQMAPTVRERFRREAALLETLGRGSQGGIPELYAYFIEGEQYYLVQEWIDGETLTQKLRREGPQPEAAVVSILLGALRVIDYIHTRPTPIIHRDIKPDNIMLRRSNGQSVLIDFGVVKEVTRVDGSSNVNTIMAGTSGYMPLEQAAGRPTFASDLYALGMTAITLTTGSHPREFVDPISGEINWRPAAPQVSPSLAAVLDIAIRRNDRERFQTARDFAIAIQGASGNTTGLSAPVVATPSLVSPPANPSGAQPLVVSAPLTYPAPLPYTPFAPSNPSVSPTPASSASGTGVAEIIHQIHAQHSGARRTKTPLNTLMSLLSIGVALVLLMAASVTLWWVFVPLS
ncbi:MAG: serine/threonine-protein kinase, partial [Chloracidobacterium sp.]